ncbi:MAG TPA: hypothetical protein VFX25_33400 [Streptosporangiaceae bacterium]|nr:hypothetical protein [Streptosporangiaceae bacterium]
MLPRLAWAEVSARRLRRSGLAEPVRDAGPADIGAAMCGARTLTAARHRELGEQAERVAAVLEGRAELTVGTVSVGAHA